MPSSEEIAEILDKIKNMPIDNTIVENETLKEDAMSFFEGNQEFMIKNRYTIGNTTFYPTSKACLRLKPGC